MWRLLPRRHNNASGDCLSIEELTAAKNIIWKLTQREVFPREVAACSQEIKWKILMTSKMVKLKPIVRESLLRVGGRLQHMPCDENVAHPIILPKTSLAVCLLVRWQHEKLVRSCLKCRAICAHPITQEVADLSLDQLFPWEPAFMKSATDCFGPFLVKSGSSEVKRYGVLFTCLTSLAIHIEMANCIDTDAFLNVLRRFVARHGPVQSIRSDNGMDFVSAEATLHNEHLNQTTINESLATRTSPGSTIHHTHLTREA
ncbi:uncharacterized protein [Macrobrachium rosenbergii]|uniref:uncharacterized protein n=1 Tax=Macrobrachium rosenbergii TaxID=79674 RepID=UPI0034D61958